MIIAEVLNRTIRKFSSTWKRNKRTRYVKGNRQVEISSIISPLRYDTLIRQNYFSYFESNIHLYKNNSHEYIQLALRNPYFLWFRDVSLARSSPHLPRHPDEVEKAYAAKIRRSADLYFRFKTNGFDLNSPIALHTAKNITATSSGKLIIRDFYAGDGCHRLALLNLFGYRYLEPEFYKVKIGESYSPLDNTIILIKATTIRESEYYAFLSMYYADKVFFDRDSLRSYVAREAPWKVSEMDRVLEIDVPVLGQSVEKD